MFCFTTNVTIDFTLHLLHYLFSEQAGVIKWHNHEVMYLLCQAQKKKAKHDLACSQCNLTCYSKE